MRPKVFINIAAAKISGPKKGLHQFIRVGGKEICDPVVVGYNLGDKKDPFILSMKKAGVPYETLSQKMTYDPFLVTRAMKILKKHKADILQSHGYKSHLICFLLNSITCIPWIAFVHGWTSENMKIKAYKALDQILLGFADRVVVVSNGLIEKMNLNWINRHKIRTIPNAVDPAELLVTGNGSNVRQRYGIGLNDPLMGVIGRFSPEKGHMFLINAMPAINKKLPKLKIMLIGDGQEKENLQKRINELGLNKSVIFTGYQNNLGDFYMNMDLLVLPSLSEGMPNVILEAMLYGKSVVATRVGGVPEVVVDGKTGIIVEPQNSEQLSLGILKMFQNPDYLRTYGMAGRERVLRYFNPAQRVKRIASLYTDVLSRN
jgi:glycosyltransferase involved in cell wall biosynthesis